MKTDEKTDEKPKAPKTYPTIEVQATLVVRIEASSMPEMKRAGKLLENAGDLIRNALPDGVALVGMTDGGIRRRAFGSIPELEHEPSAVTG